MKFSEIDNQICNFKTDKEKYKKKDFNFFKSLKKIDLKLNTIFLKLLTINIFEQIRFVIFKNIFCKI